jgi:hypothetical protein
MRMVDITGQRFGRLVVTGQHPDRDVSGHVQWILRCDCNGQAVSTKCDLKKVRSCGCIRKERGWDASHLKRDKETGRYIQKVYTPVEASGLSKPCRPTFRRNTWRSVGLPERDRSQLVDAALLQVFQYGQPSPTYQAASA